MIRIELDAFEKKDLIEYLKYAINQKKLNKPKQEYIGMKFDTTNYDIQRIEHLIEEIKNPKAKTNVYKTVEYDRYLVGQEKQKFNYMKKKKKY